MEDPLKKLKQQLKIKPTVKTHEHVKIMIKNKSGEKTKKQRKRSQDKDVDVEVEVKEKEEEEEKEEDEEKEKEEEEGTKEKGFILLDKREKSFDRKSVLDSIALHKTKDTYKSKKMSLEKDEEIMKPVLLPIEEEKEIEVEKETIVKKKPLLVIEEDDEEDEEDEKKVKEDKKVKKKEKEKSKKSKINVKEKGVVILGPEVPLLLGSEDIIKRLPKKVDPINIKGDAYYMNNREIFINYINTLFQPYKKELKSDKSNANCDKLKNNIGNFEPLTHQKIVKDYLNLYTPYRGLLLYHGLGSGKTCSSIGIAEGMKSHKQIIIMTPASLRRNYIEEIKKCGDLIYKKNQYWEWICTDVSSETDKILSSALELPIEYIRKKKGAWLVDITKKSNYESLSSEKQKSLNEQIETMINQKYRFINYNGLRHEKLREMTSDFTVNIFDNKVIVIDEVHNLISRIVNKIRKQKIIKENDKGEKEHLPYTLSMKLYEMLLSAKNAKVVLLTGTPVVNFPNEFGILFNILRGYIKTWSIKLDIKTKNKVDLSSITKMFLKLKQIDYIEYSPSTKILTITRNPFGFKNKVSENKGYKGVTNINKETKIHELEDMSDSDFEKLVRSILKKNNIEVLELGIKIQNKKALPDLLEDFNNNYVDLETKEIRNQDSLKRRILGLSSYFRSADESLLPRYERKLGVDYHIVRIPMSDYQFKKYEELRQIERKDEDPKKNIKKASVNQTELYTDPSSVYKIFSRLACNITLPDRPMPTIGKQEDNGIKTAIDAMVQQVKRKETDNTETNAVSGEEEGDDILEEIADESYSERINKFLDDINESSDNYLSIESLKTYSPKYLKILENINDEKNLGLHLIYSQFRTLEGIGLFSLVLEKHGYTRFKIKKNSQGLWMLDISPEDQGKQKYALYTGTETDEEKEIIRNIYNGNWKYVPSTISDKLNEISANNNMGEIIKILMITSSGSEGINLENTRFVHIMEPYWHPVRSQQVIGRARRICSHKNLPLELQTVEVFTYLMILTEKQISSELAIELRKKDLSKTPPKKPVTTDQLLFEISEIKEKVTSQLTDIIKVSAFDCYVHGNKGCFNFADPSNSKYSYVPDYAQQKNDASVKANLETVKLKGFKSLTFQNVKYAYKQVNPQLIELYDYESYENAVTDVTSNPVKVGIIEIQSNGEKIVKWET